MRLHHFSLSLFLLPCPPPLPQGSGYCGRKESMNGRPPTHTHMCVHTATHAQIPSALVHSQISGRACHLTLSKQRKPRKIELLTHYRNTLKAAACLSTTQSIYEGHQWPHGALSQDKETFLQKKHWFSRFTSSASWLQFHMQSCTTSTNSVGGWLNYQSNMLVNVGWIHFGYAEHVLHVPMCRHWLFLLNNGGSLHSVWLRGVLVVHHYLFNWSRNEMSLSTLL